MTIISTSEKQDTAPRRPILHLSGIVGVAHAARSDRGKIKRSWSYPRDKTDGPLLRTPITDPA